MEFFERETFWELSRSNFPRNTTAREIASAAISLQKHEYSKVQVVLELNWIEAHRPYYSVYPAIARMLLNTKLEIDCKYIKLPLSTLLIRFPKSSPLKVGETDRRLRSILVGEFEDMRCREGLRGRGLGLWCDRGEEDIYRRRVYDFQTLILQDEITVEESIRQYIDFQESDDPKALHDALRVVVGLSMMATDPEIVIPDVLSKDQNKPLTDVEIQRARRRGKIGWVVGKGVEILPHIRKPHFAIRWTGKGGTIPLLRPVKGCIVHKKEVTSVPTGLMG